MKNALTKLIKVKSIVTILLTVMFCILAYRKDISNEQFVTIFTTIIAFYFGTQSTKKGDDDA